MVSIGLPVINSSISLDNPHYSYNGSTLTVLKVSQANENFLYRCNVTNPCGSSFSGHTHLSVIELPNSINDLTISEGPDINNHVDLVWSSPPVLINHRPIDGYKVMVMEEETQYKLYSTLSSDASKTRLTNLKPGTNYTVMVMPYNLAGEAQSNVVNFNTNTSGMCIRYMQLNYRVHMRSSCIKFFWAPIGIYGREYTCIL